MPVATEADRWQYSPLEMILEWIILLGRPEDAGYIFCLLHVLPLRLQLITFCGFGDGDIRTSSAIRATCCCVASLLDKLYAKLSTKFVE